MHRQVLYATLLFLVLCWLLTTSAWGGKQAEFSSSPPKKVAKKIRVGYLEGGPYLNYPPNLTVFVDGLAQLGWLKNPDYPQLADPADARTLWEWLTTHAQSEYLVFVKNGFYSSAWDKGKRAATKEQLLTRLGKSRDLDFMIAMGTWAGQDLANNQHQVSTMVFSASDPIAAKIIKSPENSGFSHLHARVDPTRYKRQVRLFHEIFQFTKLGIAFEDSPEGRTYAAVDDIRKLAKEIGFEVVECHTLNATTDREAANASVNRCHRELAGKVQALYITNQLGVNENNMPHLMAPLLEKKIPTFSQPGSSLVRLGALMSIAQAGFKYVGDSHAQIAGKIFNGAKPGDLPQVFEDPPKISLNLETATRIGYNPSVEILVAADEIFKSIESPKE